MRTLYELVKDTQLIVQEHRKTHRECLIYAEGQRERVMQELAPKPGQLYTTLRSRHEAIVGAKVKVVEVQLKQVVTGNRMRYELSGSMQPPPACLFVVQKNHSFFAKYVREQDKLALPPFHLTESSFKGGWLHVCLGASYDPNVDTLRGLLEVANLADAYMNLVSLADHMGWSETPEPFASWAKVYAGMEAGARDIPGLSRREEMSL